MAAFYDSLLATYASQSNASVTVHGHGLLVLTSPLTVAMTFDKLVTGLQKHGDGVYTWAVWAQSKGSVGTGILRIRRGKLAEHPDLFKELKQTPSGVVEFVGKLEPGVSFGVGGKWCAIYEVRRLHCTLSGDPLWVVLHEQAPLDGRCITLGIMRDPGQTEWTVPLVVEEPGDSQAPSPETPKTTLPFSPVPST